MLEDIIRQIVGSFSKGDKFDTHTIINEIFKVPEYHIAYLNGFPKCAESLQNYHSQISKLIEKCNGIKSEGKIKTHNIYGNISENELWVKL